MPLCNAMIRLNRPAPPAKPVDTHKWCDAHGGLFICGLCSTRITVEPGEEPYLGPCKGQPNG